MIEADLTDATMRQFLLGDLDGAERQAIEEVFICDADAKIRILMAEDDLIEDYLEDSLSPAEQEKFLTNYLSAPQQWGKLRIAKSLKKSATEQAGVKILPAPHDNIPGSRWRGCLNALRGRHRLLVIPVTGFLAVAIALGAVWLVQFRRLNSRLAQENAHRLAIEHELREINTPSNTGQERAPNQVLSLVLPPISIRSLGPPVEVESSNKAELLELRLLWTDKDQYAAYQATLHRVGSTEQFTIPNLHLDDKPGGKTVRLKIPLHILTRGVYEIQLSGVGVDGKPGSPLEYKFVMSAGSTTGS